MNSPLTEKVLALAVDGTRSSRDEILAAINNPDWDKAMRVHDWRNHVDSDIAKLWDCVSLDARLIAYIDAANDAQSEVWS